MRLIALALLLSALRCASATATQAQVINGGSSLAVGPDGTLYMLGFGIINPTPGAYLATLASPATAQDFLKHFDPVTGQVLYATYLSFSASGILVDSTGAAYVTGWRPNYQFRITPGAYNRNFPGGEQFVVAKLNPSGSAVEFASVFGGSGSQFSPGIAGLALGRNGAIYVTGETKSKDFPTTSDAFQTGPQDAAQPYGSDAFLSELSADGSQLLYSTYLGASRPSGSIGIALGDDGTIHLGGYTDAPDFPTTPGTFTFPMADSSTFHDRVFLATWDPASRQFTSLAAFGTYLVPWLFVWKGSRVAIAVQTVGNEPLPGVPQPLWPVAENLDMLMVLDETNWHALYAIGLRDSNYGGIVGLALDTDGALTIVGSPGAGFHLIPPSPGAASLSSGFGQFIAQIDSAGHRLTVGTYFEAPGPFVRATVTADRIYVVTRGFFGDNDAIFSVAPPFPLIPAPPSGNCATIYALPNAVQQCGAGMPAQTLFWNVCDPAIPNAQVHTGSPDGPLLASSTSGVLDIAPSNTTYYLTDTAGGILASEHVSYEAAPRCGAVPSPKGQLYAANPVLSCVESPLTGTQTTISGAANISPLDIHVLAPAGPEFTHSSLFYISAQTGDWVRDYLPFFLTASDTGEALAMERTFLLPIRSCQPNAPPPPPALQAKPNQTSACGFSAPSRAIFAWYSAGVHPIEIRETSATGRTIARFDQTRGLFDVSPTATMTYHLVGYSAGAWLDLSSETISVDTLLCGK